MIVIKISLYVPGYEEFLQPCSCIMRLRIVTRPCYNTGVPVFRYTSNSMKNSKRVILAIYLNIADVFVACCERVKDIPMVSGHFEFIGAKDTVL
jgi:hypothetical protein